MYLRKLKENIVHKVMFSISIFVLSLGFFMAFGLYERAKPILAKTSLLNILFSTSWHPSEGKFGLGKFIAGTFWVTSIAIIIAVPLSILTAIYLEEYAPKKIKNLITPLIDLLAGISPVIYGVWGVIAIVPFVEKHLIPFFSERFNFFPFQTSNFTGFSIITGAMVLAVMVFPIIISVAVEVIKTVPFEIKEASLALGATKWQTIKFAILKKTKAGIIAAIILGLSRALGETMAVLMVTGCNFHDFPKSIFDTAYPLPALIANTYGEMMSIPLYDSAILLAAFILLVITALFNIIGWGTLLFIERKSSR